MSSTVHHRHPVEHYAQVAEIYDEALEAGDAPTQAIAEAYDVPYTTAARWVRRTRDLGLLPPPSPGRAVGNTSRNEGGEGVEGEEYGYPVDGTDRAVDKMRDMPVGVSDPNVVGDAGPTDVPPGQDRPHEDSDESAESPLRLFADEDDNERIGA